MADTDFRLSDAHLRDSLDRLADADADIAATLAGIGYPPERRMSAGFPALLRIIVGQQLSTKAAATIWRRLEIAMNGAPDPAGLLALEDAALRAAGLSRAKVLYARGLAEAVLEGRLDPAGLAALPDDETQSAITALKGFGPWSANMYLMFALGRPDIWPADDLGVREGLRRIRRLDARPTVTETRALGEDWTPHRSAAAMLCWHILHNAPA